MFTIKNYVIVKDLEEAYILNQKRNNVILGGTLWLKMGEKNINHAIDLSELGLDKIEEREDSFHIDCMVTLRDLELSKALNAFFNGSIEKALKHIVGVQFRNCATIGGSVYGRYGFSDVITCLLALDTYVELYKGGVIPLAEFVDRGFDHDVLVRVIIKKDLRQVAYLTHRKTATDFPIITCAVARNQNKWEIVLGARPSRGKRLPDTENRLSGNPTDAEICDFIDYAGEQFEFGSNMRGSKEYRKHLAGVLIKRGIKEITEEKVL